MTDEDVRLPELIGQPAVAKLLRRPLNTVHSWRARGDDRLPEADVVVSGTPFWLAQRWSSPGEPLPRLPPLVGVMEVAVMFDVEPDTVTMWFKRAIGAPGHVVKIGRTRIWTIPPWVEFARKTNRPIDVAALGDAGKASTET